MCVTTGRSGTKLLAKLLALGDDVCARHEPEPALHHVLEEVKRDPAAALRFVREVKLPAIQACPEKNYAETSHLFGKGFYEAFLKLELPFKIIILNRNPRDVARSLWRIGTVPGRTPGGRTFLLEPLQQNVLKLRNWERMTDYELCYWYCLEMERRKTLYAEECTKRGIAVVETSIERLKQYSSFLDFMGACGLTVSAKDTRARHAEIVAKKVNRKIGFRRKRCILPYSFHERRVWKNLIKDEKGTMDALQRSLHARYGLSGSVG